MIAVTPSGSGSFRLWATKREAESSDVPVACLASGDGVRVALVTPQTLLTFANRCTEHGAHGDTTNYERLISYQPLAERHGHLVWGFVGTKLIWGKGIHVC